MMQGESTLGRAGSSVAAATPPVEKPEWRARRVLNSENPI